MELFKQLRTISIANAVITLLSGLLLCLWPENANSLIVTLICIFIIFNGIINLLEFFLELRYHSLNKGGLLIAVLKILFGIYLFTHKNILSAFLGIFFSVYIVMEGCNGIEEAYRLFRYKVRGSLISLILSSFCIIFNAENPQYASLLTVPSFLSFITFLLQTHIYPSCNYTCHIFNQIIYLLWSHN